jgi:uncharacterized circularly permuted ATP-grasp superfamily protein/uncharacterized alpha-E superfamily protein
MSEANSTTTAQAVQALLSKEYATTRGFNELFQAPGKLHPVWEQFAPGLVRLGAAGIRERAEHARHLLRENGVTYNAVGAPVGPDRPWELDPIPLLIASQEWKQLALGLAQRATLLNALLKDLYGPQRTLLTGVLPPTVVYGNPAYMVACRQIQPRGGQHIVLHGCNLARQPNGTWCVLADRTQGPSGVGYALENRIVISRTLPQDFASLHIERLAGFFSCLRETLRNLSPEVNDNPRIVLLSPGPKSSRYFEDGYLARYLGYTLVEGGDLTVRGDRVFLKTLGGLIPVNVILRRVLDGDCDPLELRPESMLGSPGLLQAVRTGQLALANAIGSGLLESPVYQAFLPEICRVLLDQELQIPCQPTWWCGQAEGLTRLREGFDQLLLRKAFVHRHSPPIDGRSLSAQERQNWLAKVLLHPEEYVVQEPIQHSQAPTWNAGTIATASINLRTFAVSHASGYQILPGGLCRVSLQSQGLDNSAASGQMSKDVWVVSDRPVPPTTLLPNITSAVELRRSTNDVPSRVADHMFWLGRYAERAEALARHLRSGVVRFTNELEPANWKELRNLALALEEPTMVAYGEDITADQFPAWFQDLIFNQVMNGNVTGSLAQLLQALQRTASHVRDRLSLDGWRLMHQLDIQLLFPWQERQPLWGEVLLLLNQVLNLISAFSGVSTESMTRGPGWRFLDMGRRIERSLQILSLVRRTLVTAVEFPTPMLEAVLEIADSSMTYRHRYLASLQIGPVLDLILIDETNPRAVGFQLNALSDHVDAIPALTPSPQRSPEQRIMLGMQATLRLTDVDALTEANAAGRRDRLERFLVSLEEQLRALATSLNHHYLAHTTPTHQLRASRSAGRNQA